MASNTEPDLEDNVTEVVEQNVVDSKARGLTRAGIPYNLFRIPLESHIDFGIWNS